MTCARAELAERLLATRPRRTPGPAADRLWRALEVVIASVAFVLVVPVLALAALLIRRESRGPAVFRQQRIGLGGRPFVIFKLRTMRAGPWTSNWEVPEANVHAGHGDARMWKALRDPRVTRTGAVVRALAIDELPQLVNVVRGEMALVGPRPLTEDEDRRIDGRWRQRGDVRPGMTGLWQVLGGNDIPMDGMLRLDCEYVRRRSVRVDLRLLALTPAALRRGLEAWRHGSTG